jgi:hypothetical protein
MQARIVLVSALTLLLSACPSSSDRAAVTWSRSFGDSNWDEAATAIPDAQGGYLFAGTAGALYASRGIYLEQSVDGDLWLARLDSSGNPLWQRSYGERPLSAAGHRVFYTLACGARDGGTWIAGDESASETRSGDPIADGGNLIVSRLDAAGTLLWTRIHDSGAFAGHPFTSPQESALESVRDVAATPDGGLLVACWLSARVDKPLQGRRGVEVNALWIAKLDAEGQLVWGRHLTSDEHRVEYDRYFPYEPSATIHLRLGLTDEGGALVAAYSSKHENTRLARLQANGSVLWVAAQNDGHVRDVVPIDANGDGRRDDGFVLAGVAHPFDGREGFVSRIDALGQSELWHVLDDQVWGYSAVAQRCFVDGFGGLVCQLAAVGTRWVDGARREGRLRLLDVDGNGLFTRDPYPAESTPDLRYVPAIDGWELLGLAGDAAFVARFAWDFQELGRHSLERVPAFATARLLDDGGVLDVEFRSEGPGESVLTRQDAAGNVALQRSFPLASFREWAHALVEIDPAAGGGMALLGESAAFDTGADTPWLLRLDQDGEIVWQRLFPGVHLRSPFLDRAELFTATQDGGFALAAWIDGHLRLFKLDGDGRGVWNSAPLSPDMAFGFEKCSALIETADGGFALAGTASAGSDEPGHPWIARLDPEGRLLWGRSFLDERSATALLETEDGLVLAGVRADSICVTRLDPAGDVLSDIVYPFDGALPAPGARLAPAEDGGLLVATDLVRHAAPGEFEDGAASTGRLNVLLLRLDPAGEPLWYRVYGGLYDEHVSDVRPVPRGGYLVAGGSDSLGDRGEAWLLRVDSEGLITEACNAYLEGGQWPFPRVELDPGVLVYSPDIRPEEELPAALASLDTEVPTLRLDGIVVARQCLGFTAPDGGEDGGGESEFTLTLVFEGGGSGRVASNPAGIDCSATCSARFAAGTRVVLVPAVDAGSFFSHWEGADEDFGIEGCAVTLTSARTVTVFFE